MAGKQQSRREHPKPLPVPTVATLPILATLCTEKRLKTLQSVWRHFVLKTHKKLYERTRLYRSCCLRSYMCDERRKQPSQHAEERGGRSKLLKAQQALLVLERYTEQSEGTVGAQAQIVGASRQVQNIWICCSIFVCGYKRFGGPGPPYAL